MVIEQGHYAVRSGHSLAWARIRVHHPKALVFVPPLVGGTVGQQIRAFRRLVKGGFELFTFNYSGHGRSAGRFSLKASLCDVHDMLRKAQHLGHKEGLPLFGIASCYSAIPFLHATDRLSEPMKRLVLINAISRLSPSSVIRSFLSYYHQTFSFAEGGGGIRMAFLRYADILFPGVAKSLNGFGMLQRERARFGLILSEFFTLDPLRNVRLERTPTLCLYATRDPVLDIYADRRRSSYRKDIKRICPEAEFCALEGDHFLSQPAARGRATKMIASYFEAGLPLKQ